MDPLFNEMIQRAVQQEMQRQAAALPPAWHSDTPASAPNTPLSPTAALIGGGIADAASTYAFLKQRTGTEDNAMFGGMNNSPAGVASTLLATTAGAYGLKKLLDHFGLKRLTDVVAGNLGSTQAALAATNLGLGRTYGIASTNDLLRDGVTHKR
jgi:hypothetical protein